MLEGDVKTTHVEHTQPVVKDEKDTDDTPNVIQVMMVIQQVRIRVKTTPDLVKTSEDRGKDANKETLETEKEKDTTQKVTVNRRRRSESTR
jgi:hypothetical protein